MKEFFGVHTGVVSEITNESPCERPWNDIAFAAQEEAFWTLPARAFSDQDASITLEKEEINILKLYEQKRRLLNQERDPIIKPIALEHIARLPTMSTTN